MMPVQYIDTQPTGHNISVQVVDKQSSVQMMYVQYIDTQPTTHHMSAQSPDKQSITHTWLIVPGTCHSSSIPVHILSPPPLQISPSWHAAVTFEPAQGQCPLPPHDSTESVADGLGRCSHLFRGLPLQEPPS